MLLDVSRALRMPGEVFPFLHREEIAPQEIFGETVTFSVAALAGHFSMAGESLHLWGEMTVTAHGHCAGCLKPVDDEMKIPFDEIFVRQEGRYPQTENADQDEDERLVFEGSKVELSQLALTLAVLELPMRFECKEGCQTLAEMQPDIQPTHACQKDMPDQHPFSALQQLLTKDQEV